MPLPPMRRATFVALAAATVLGGPAGAAAIPPPPVRSPVRSPVYDDAVAAIEATIERDRRDPLIEDAALPRLYAHGKPVTHSVLLYHGFTNCPQQFDELARQFYDRGCNVYVPRIPLHGYRDRLTNALSGLTDAMLRDATTESYRLARGLGTSVSAVGLSLGGEMALYLAQTQPIDHAVPVAPFLMPIGFPTWLGLTTMRLVSFVPDIYVWWDPRIKAKCLPIYAYPGFPSHALAECIFFGNAIVDLAANVPPLGRRCTLVTNAHESAVNNDVAIALIDRWKAEGKPYDRVVLTDLGAPRHDIIDPTTFPQGRLLVYPALEKIVLG